MELGRARPKNNRDVLLNEEGFPFRIALLEFLDDPVAIVDIAFALSV